MNPMEKLRFGQSLINQALDELAMQPDIAVDVRMEGSPSRLQIGLHFGSSPSGEGWTGEVGPAEGRKVLSPPGPGKTRAGRAEHGQRKGRGPDKKPRKRVRGNPHVAYHENGKLDIDATLTKLGMTPQEIWAQSWPHESPQYAVKQAMSLRGFRSDYPYKETGAGPTKSDQREED